MTLPKMIQQRIEQSDVLDSEIAWLRSFGWDNRQIALRLGVTVSCVEKHAERKTQA